MAIKPEIKYGTLCAAGLILWTLIQYFSGFHTIRLSIGQYSGFGNYLIVIVCIWLGLKEKQLDDSGHLSIRKGIREALLQLAITATLSSIFMFIYDYHINPFWVDNMIQFQRDTPGKLNTFARFANDPDATAIVLSNTETHLCVHFLSILFIGSIAAALLSCVFQNNTRKDT
jgi:phosphatidylserine decarboxylase